MTLPAIFGRRHVIGRWFFFFRRWLKKKIPSAIELDPGREARTLVKGAIYHILEREGKGGRDIERERERDNLRRVARVNEGGRLSSRCT